MSWNEEKYPNFNDPKIIRLNNQIEYAAPKIIPKDANSVNVLLIWKELSKTSTSPIKLLVPGNPKLANVKKRKNTPKRGITWIKPE
uniref:Putative orf85 protein n=1 Tax=Chondrus crispus TaxID=2769 RepID=Q36338_CHOCR|nr:putative orf85 [Chondrus crispus]